MAAKRKSATSVPPTGNGWNEWKIHVLSELDRIGDNQETMHGDFEDFRIEITKSLGKIYNNLTALNVKSGMWGALGGMIPVAIFIMYEVIKKG